MPNANRGKRYRPRAEAASRVVKRAAKGALHGVGLDVQRYRALPRDFDASTRRMVEVVAPYTKTSPARLAALREAVRYLVAHDVPGAIVECGVWRGGSVMAAALTLLECGDKDRDLYLFDTFEGMVTPTEKDVRHDGVRAEAILESHAKTDETSTWCAVTEPVVREALSRVAYPPDRTHIVKGRVEDTVPEQAPERIALLRLDTDWYESTKHELVHLVPRIVDGGVLIIDDFGHWLGARRAVEEYLAETRLPLLLQRIDESGRMAVVHRTS